MNPDIKIKQHIYILAGIVILWAFGAEALILGKKPAEIKRFEAQISQLKDQISKLEGLEAQSKSLNAEADDLKSSFETLLMKFPNNENTENDLSRVVAKITQKIIVSDEKLKLKKITEYVPNGVEEEIIPQITPTDPPLTIDPKILVANYESELTIRCNYFELLEFLHNVANQEIFLTPMDLSVQPDEETPYGVTAKVRLLSFGFEKDFNLKK